MEHTRKIVKSNIQLIDFTYSQRCTICTIFFFKLIQQSIIPFECSHTSRNLCFEFLHTEIGSFFLTENVFISTELILFNATRPTHIRYCEAEEIKYYKPAIMIYIFC